jgi:hypothetical protein
LLPLALAAAATGRATFRRAYSSGGAGRANNIVGSTIGVDTFPGRSAARLRCAADPGSILLNSMRSRLKAGTRDLAFDERLLNHKMAGLGVAAFDKAARLEHLAQLFQHRRTAAHHDSVDCKIERRQADIAEQLF